MMSFVMHINTQKNKSFFVNHIFHFSENFFNTLPTVEELSDRDRHKSQTQLNQTKWVAKNLASPGMHRQ